MDQEHESGIGKTAYGRIASAKDLGRVIRTKRKEIGMRQETAAGMTGVGTKFLSQLENGKETAELGKALQVLHKMGLELYVFPRNADPFKER
ncbi:helix-turn-helix domain-containing protein [Geomonas subterranea]|uniref:helix-turn-helix domain-containing protein n=1 Tax=Geomonas subterranea TaxID=2847989 RepID=UPI001CD34E84|nr:helix-turn-helix domain-containing protein [Geomonas fuzhouensis]